MDCYLNEELQYLLGSVGKNVSVDRSVKFLNPKNICIGDNVRIDSWCFFSAQKEIRIGNYVHIGLFGQFSANGGTINISDFCGISSRVSMFTATDDYTDGWMTNPMIPSEFRKVRCGQILLEKHVIVGCNSVILPGSTLEVGCSVGALSLVNKSVPKFTVVSGNPLKVICKRDGNRLMDLESQFCEKLK